MIDINEARKACREAVRFKAKLGHVGLFRTMQKMEAVVTEVGYELAEAIERKREKAKEPKP